MFGQLLCALGPEQALLESAHLHSTSKSVAAPQKDSAVAEELPPPAYSLLDGGANESWLVSPASAADLSITKLSLTAKYDVSYMYETPYLAHFLSSNHKILEEEKRVEFSETISPKRFKEVGLLALQDILFLLRIASKSCPVQI